MDQDSARHVRDLLRSCDRAALATTLSSPLGSAAWPYVSLVLVAVDHDLSPILLLSDLAEHSRAIANDARVSLLFDGTAGEAQPLAGARITLLGEARQTTDERLKRRFLARHPDAEAYAAFGDFHFYQVLPARAHLVAGFGRIRWIERAEIAAAPTLPDLARHEQDIVSHMNQDHADAIQLYAGKLLGLSGSEWTMTGIDAEGIDLRQGGLVARVPFDAPLAAASEARGALIALVKRARE